MHTTTHPAHARPFGLTLRRQMILVAYFAVIFAVLARRAGEPGRDHVSDVLWSVLLLTPWVLGGLVAAFDRPGPTRNWMVAVVLFLFYPALAVYLDLTLVWNACQTGVWPAPWAALIFNLLIAGPSLVVYRRMAPARCPACAQNALIPLVRITGQSHRLHGTRCCAACDALYWRDRQGAWQVERRASWCRLTNRFDALDLEVEIPPRHDAVLGTHSQLRIPT